jgi:hypothetical protein
LYKKLDQSRPRQKTRGNLYYSLGKKRHKVKTQIVVNNQCIIIHKTGHKKGKRHDYNSCRYKNNHPATPENIANVNVFLPWIPWSRKRLSKQASSLPKREKNGVNLSKGGKEYNQYYAKKRIDMEHNMCRIKNHRIMSDTFRNRLSTTGYRI